jgi:hypothetical protein
MGLLNQLRHDDNNIHGLVSSYPAACLAAAKAFRSERISISFVNPILNIIGSINTVRLDFIKGTFGRDHESVPNTLCQKC